MTLGVPAPVLHSLAVVPALVMGVLIQRAGGAPAAWTAVQLASAALGLLAALGSPWLARRIGTHPVAWAAAFVAVIASTLADPGFQGVHRWVSLGPVRLHVALLVEPVVLVCLVLLWKRARESAALVILAALFALHLAQPDAGQAASLAAATLALVATGGGRAGARAAALALAAVALGGTWLRVDPLAPVAFVEDALARAFALGTLAGIAALAAVLAIPGTALAQSVAASDSRARTFAAVLGAYFAAGIAVTAWGAFPVPVLGYGASPVLGTMLGLSFLGEEVWRPFG